MRQSYELLMGARRQQSNRTPRRRTSGPIPNPLSLDYHQNPITPFKVGDSVNVQGAPANPMRVWKIEDGKVFVTATHNGNDIKSVVTPSACTKV